MPAEGRWPIGRRGGAPILLLAHRCCVGLAAGLCARRGGWTWTRWRPSPVLPKKCCRSRDGSYAYVCSKGGIGVNVTLCRTHGLKPGACWRPETERQSLSPRPSHDSCAAFREFVTHNGTARPPQFDYRDPRGSLHAPRHSVASSIRGSNRPESPRGTCPTLSPATAVHSVPSRDLERSSRLEGDCCQCEREPRAPAQPRRPVADAHGRRAS